MKFPIFFYTFLWFPIAILNIVSVILPFAFIEFNEECKFPIDSIPFSGFQKLFVGLLTFQLFHFSIRKFKGLNFLPKSGEPDFALATITYVVNLCSSTMFFLHVSDSKCPVTMARIQGTFRILGILGIPILIYGINYDGPVYNVIIAQPVDEGLELPIYTIDENENPYVEDIQNIQNENEDENEDGYIDIEV